MSNFRKVARLAPLALIVGALVACEEKQPPGSQPQAVQPVPASSVAQPTGVRDRAAEASAPLPAEKPDEPATAEDAALSKPLIAPSELEKEGQRARGKLHREGKAVDRGLRHEEAATRRDLEKDAERAKGGVKGFLE